MSHRLAERVMVLRDEVLAEAQASGDRDLGGAEIFDAVVRAVAAHGDTSPGLDLTLHDAISRRLAWGDRESAVLVDADAVCERLCAAAQRAFRDPAEELLVVEIATEVASAAARVVAVAAIGRLSRERSARLREEMTQRRLKDELARQESELARIHGRG